MANPTDPTRTGLLFEPGNPQALANAVNTFLSYPYERKLEMRQAARSEYLAKYTAERNYKVLMDIYHLAIERAGRSKKSEARNH